MLNKVENDIHDLFCIREIRRFVHPKEAVFLMRSSTDKYYLPHLISMCKN